jgi:hypothetical protein
LQFAEFLSEFLPSFNQLTNPIVDNSARSPFPEFNGCTGLCSNSLGLFAVLHPFLDVLSIVWLVPISQGLDWHYFMYCQAIRQGVLANASSAEHYWLSLAGTEVGRLGCHATAASFEFAAIHILGMENLP